MIKDDDDRFTADTLYDRILAATYANPGDDVAQAAAAHRLAGDLAGHIAALEALAQVRDRQLLDLVQPPGWVDTPMVAHGDVLSAVGEYMDALEDLLAAVGEMLNAIEKAHEDDEWLDWPPLNEWNALLRAYNALAAVGQGETKNAPTGYVSVGAPAKGKGEIP